MFPSEHEEDVGMLNKAAPLKGPQPDWDPDIVATLDDDYEHCDLLEDDFVGVANGSPSDGNHDDRINKLPADDKDDVSTGSCDQQWETKSRFTEYSITSSVVPRSEGLELLDEKFEQFYAQYEDDEFDDDDDDDGDSDDDTAECDKHLLDQAVEDFENKFRVKCKIPSCDVEKGAVGSHDLSSQEEELVEVSDDCDEKHHWDCESILSTYSNLYNHPVTISDPKPVKVNKQGIPLDVLRDKKSEGESKANTEHSEPITVTPSVIRHKGETKEEKQARKHLVKQHNKQRRITKKATHQVYKNEELRQKKLNSKPQSSIIVL